MKLLGVEFRTAIVVGLLALVPITTMASDLEDGVAAYEAWEYQKSLRLLRPLAEAGNPKAQYYLGLMYERGESIPKDLAEAHAWYNLSSSQGAAQAREARDRVGAQLTPEQLAKAQQLALDRQKQAEARSVEPSIPPPSAPSTQPSEPVRDTTALRAILRQIFDGERDEYRRIREGNGEKGKYSTKWNSSVMIPMAKSCTISKSRESCNFRCTFGARRDSLADQEERFSKVATIISEVIRPEEWTPSSSRYVRGISGYVFRDPESRSKLFLKLSERHGLYSLTLFSVADD